MAALLTTNTARFVVRQAWRGRALSTLHRFPATANLIDALNGLAALYTTIGTISYTNWGVTGVDYYPINDTVGQPAATFGFPLAGTSGTDPGTLPDAYQIQVLGRTLGGRRVSYYHQGLIAELDANLRLTAAENVDVGTLLSAYDTMQSFEMTAIDGIVPVLKPYVNVVINDYLTRRSRRG